MTPERKRRLRSALYTRKSSEEGLEQSFNSLDAQREACEAYVQSQRHEGWIALPTRYDDGGYSGGSMERPALKALLADIDAGKVDVVVVYKVDRLTRSLADFAKIVERFDASGVSFVSVTQQFNTASSMGRLTLNVLLSFAQFEREVTGERIRDKIAASKKKGMWMGGNVPLGYDLNERKLVILDNEASIVRRIYERYLALGCVRKLAVELKTSGVLSKRRVSATGRKSGGVPYSRGALYSILANRLYLGEVAHRGAVYAGEHPAIVGRALWDRVQRQLAANRTAQRTGARMQEPSLLAGILYDDLGHRMTPSHCVNGGKRFRYYFNQDLLRSESERAGAVRRLPAAELEGLVRARICTFLASSAAVSDLAENATDAMTRKRLLGAGQELARKFARCTTSELRAFLLAVVSRIAVAEGAIKIDLAKPCLRSALLGERKSDSDPTRANEDDLLRLEIEAQLRRCGSQVRLVIPPTAQPASTKVDLPLVKAVARAHAWYEELKSGKAASLGAIADRLGIHQRYVGRIIRCAFLAPDIVEAVLEGRQPPLLTVERLRLGVPLAWEEQRRRFGFR